MLEQPALGDSQFETGTVFGRAATSPQARQIDLLDMDPTVLHHLNAVGDLSTSLRAAVSVSDNGLGSTNFCMQSRYRFLALSGNCRSMIAGQSGIFGHLVLPQINGIAKSSAMSVSPMFVPFTVKMAHFRP